MEWRNQSKTTRSLATAKQLPWSAATVRSIGCVGRVHPALPPKTRPRCPSRRRRLLPSPTLSSPSSCPPQSLTCHPIHASPHLGVPCIPEWGEQWPETGCPSSTTICSAASAAAISRFARRPSGSASPILQPAGRRRPRRVDSRCSFPRIRAPRPTPTRARSRISSSEGDHRRSQETQGIFVAADVGPRWPDAVTIPLRDFCALLGTSDISRTEDDLLHLPLLRPRRVR